MLFRIGIERFENPMTENAGEIPEILIVKAHIIVLKILYIFIVTESQMFS